MCRLLVGGLGAAGCGPVSDPSGSDTTMGSGTEAPGATGTGAGMTGEAGSSTGDGPTSSGGSTGEGSSSSGGSEASTSAAPFCGDGVVDAGEACDDGNFDDLDGCPSGASGQCAGAAVCGDGLVWAGVEACDDGNAVDVDACPSGVGACLAPAGCGDGFIWEGEEDCEDGNGEDLDGCSNACSAPRWVFISSKARSGVLGGVAGADAFCQADAEAAGLPGEYMAWLAQDADSAPVFRFQSTAFKGWYLLPTVPPVPVAQGWADLTEPNEDDKNNYLRNAIGVDEFGVAVGEKHVWTNTDPDGTEHEWMQDCEDWSAIPMETGGGLGLSRIDVLSKYWSYSTSFECFAAARLYCFQVK